jgi:hypothetical protein
MKRMSKSWVDPGSQDSDFEEDLEFVEPCLDLNNFPDPSKFLPLVSFGIETESDFIRWWRKRTGNTITKFECFTRPTVQRSNNDNSMISPAPVKKERKGTLCLISIVLSHMKMLEALHQNISYRLTTITAFIVPDRWLNILKVAESTDSDRRKRRIAKRKSPNSFDEFG